MSYKRKTPSNDSFATPTARKPAVHPYQRVHENMAMVAPTEAHLPYRQRFPKFGKPYEGFRSPMQSPYAKKSVTPESDYIPKKSQAAVKRLLAGATKMAYTQSKANMDAALDDAYPAAPRILQLLSTGTTNKIETTKDSILLKSVEIKALIRDADNTISSYAALYARVIIVWVTNPTGHAESTGTEATVADFLVTPTFILSHIIPEHERNTKFEVLHDEMIFVGASIYTDTSKRYVNFNVDINKTVTTAIPGTFTYQTVTNGVPYLILLGEGDGNVTQHCIYSRYNDVRATYVA